jgi:hypothetical protein
MTPDEMQMWVILQDIELRNQRGEFDDSRRPPRNFALGVDRGDLTEDEINLEIQMGLSDEDRRRIGLHRDDIP